MRFSIIIPTYNSSDYLRVCLKRLLLQDYPKDEYEIIVIDDASTENIGEAISETLKLFISQNQNIHPPHLELFRHDTNKRQGGARNTGLKKAKGDYIFFLDSDDYWCAANTLSVFNSVLKFQNFDIIRSVSWNEVSADAVPDFKNIKKDITVTCMTGASHLSGSNFFYNIWTSCYKRTFLIEHACFFRENVVYEDSDWSVKSFWLAQNIGLIAFPFYAYRSNPESTTLKPRIQSFNDNITSISAIEDFILSVDMPDDCKRACYSRIKKSILSYIRISRYYPVSASTKSLRSIRRSLLTDTIHYDMSWSDHIKFKALLHCPFLTAVVVKTLTLSKRFALKCLGKSK